MKVIILIFLEIILLVTFFILVSNKTSKRIVIPYPTYKEFSYVDRDTTIANVKYQVIVTTQITTHLRLKPLKK